MVIADYLNNRIIKSETKPPSKHLTKHPNVSVPIQLITTLYMQEIYLLRFSEVTCKSEYHFTLHKSQQSHFLFEMPKYIYRL